MSNQLDAELAELEEGKRVTAKLQEIAGKDLKGWQVIQMYEVYKTDDDGRRVATVGFFRSEEIATAFAGNQRDAAWHKVGQTMVLTNGQIGFQIDQYKPVKLFDEEEEVLRVRNAALAKLSPSERKLLGFGE